MNLLKKIKFGHLVLVILLYMGVNIGLKIHKISEAIYGTPKESKTVLLDTYDFDGTPIEFYKTSYQAPHAMMNGVEINFHTGYYNKDKTKHIYLEQWEKRTIKQNGEIIEPVFKIESNKFQNIYVYEFDINSEIYGKETDIEYDVSITSSLSDSKQLDIDFDELANMMNSWRLMANDEKFVHKYKQYHILDIENNWDIYDFRFCHFNPNNTSFSLLDNEKIIIDVYHNYRNYYYELTETQYQEFIDLIEQGLSE